MGSHPRPVECLLDAGCSAGMSHPPLAITGSTGRVGGGVARRLADAGVPQRLIVRDPSRAPQLPATGVVQAAYANDGGSGEALRGVDVLFMVSGSEAVDRVAQHTAFVDAAAGAGVRHIIYTSFLGAAPDATFTLGRDHWGTEEHIRASGMAFTFLRDNLYADFFPYFGGEDGVIRGPAGEGRVAAIAIDDIADVAVAVLAEPAAHEGHVYDLTGPEALTMAESASIMTRALGKPFSFYNESVDEAYESRAVYRAEAWRVDAWVSTYTAIAAGEMERVAGDVERVAGHPPLSFEALMGMRGAGAD